MVWQTILIIVGILVVLVFLIKFFSSRMNNPYSTSSGNSLSERLRSIAYGGCQKVSSGFRI